MPRFKVEKQSGRSGYWRVLDTQTGTYVESYCCGRPTAREWAAAYEHGKLNFSLEERGIPPVQSKA